MTKRLYFAGYARTRGLSRATASFGGKSSAGSSMVNQVAVSWCLGARCTLVHGAQLGVTALSLHSVHCRWRRCIGAPKHMPKTCPKPLVVLRNTIRKNGFVLTFGVGKHMLWVFPNASVVF